MFEKILEIKFNIMKNTILFATILSVTSIVSAQEKNFIDQPYVETFATVDTLVTPDRIYLNIFISEKDTKDKISLEELENKMEAILKSLKIDTKKDLVLQDLASNFKTYFLKQKDVLKNKLYQLKVTDAQTAGKVIVGLENAGISNVQLDRTEYSKMEKLQIILKSKAVLKAKEYAAALTQPLGQKVGSAIYIFEQNQQSYDGLYGKAAGISIRGMSTKTENYEPIDIEFQKIKVQVSAGVKFKLLD